MDAVRQGSRAAVASLFYAEVEGGYSRYNDVTRRDVSMAPSCYKGNTVEHSMVHGIRHNQGTLQMTQDT